MKILIIDDDLNICELVRLYLEKEGWQTVITHNGVKALESFSQNDIDFVILDIMMPGDDGIVVCKNIRKLSNVPIIMLTAKGETRDIIAGLEAGADDYICKPFDSKELVARVKAVSRRTSEVQTENGIAEFENLSIDIVNYRVMLHGKQVEMPPKELELLYYMASNPNKVLTRDKLLNEVWGFEFYGDTRTVDVHVKRIREKLEGNNSWGVKTVWGVGYMFEV